MPSVDQITHAHFVDDVLDPATGLPIVPGGSQSVSVLGPFHVTADDLNGETGDTIALGDELPIGTVVVLGWDYATSDWVSDVPADTDRYLLVGDVSANQGLYDITGDWLVGEAHGVGIFVPELAAVNTRRILIVIEAGVTLRFGVYAPGLSAGEADIYALIATPS